MSYNKLFSKKNIREYNKEMHVGSGLIGDDLFTLDESEIQNFKDWVGKKRPNQKFKITVEFHQSVEKRRKSSFWFDGYVATVTDGITTLNIMAVGMLHGSLDMNSDVLDRNKLVKEAKKRGYSDKKINELGKNDMFSNFNWFNLEVVKGNEFESLEKTIDNLDDAISEAKAYINKQKEENKLQKFFEEEDFQVHLFTQDKKQCAEIEKWTERGVDMIITLIPFNKNQFIKYVNDFDVDDEIDTLRKDEKYKNHFSITESLKDFTDFHNMLKDVAEKLK